MSKSMVWAHFEPLENGAECNVIFCRRPFVRNSTNSTKAYWSHLKYHHPQIYKTLRATVSEESRQRREDRPHLCAKCQLHGLNVPVKNHSRVCPFLDCDCGKCDRLRQQRVDDSRRRLLARRRRRVFGRTESPADGSLSPGSVASVSTSERTPSPSATVSPPSSQIPDIDVDFQPTVYAAELANPLLSLRFVPPEVGMDFDPLAMALLWNNVHRSGSQAFA